MPFAIAKNTKNTKVDETKLLIIPKKSGFHH